MYCYVVASLDMVVHVFINNRCYQYFLNIIHLCLFGHCLARMKWRQLTGVLCDKKVPIKLKYKLYKKVIKLTITHRTECCAVRNKDKNRLCVAGMRML